MPARALIALEQRMDPDAIADLLSVLDGAAPPAELAAARV